jgi:hypothetical protein
MPIARSRSCILFLPGWVQLVADFYDVRLRSTCCGTSNEAFALGTLAPLALARLCPPCRRASLYELPVHPSCRTTIHISPIPKLAFGVSSSADRRGKQSKEKPSRRFSAIHSFRRSTLTYDRLPLLLSPCASRPSLLIVPDTPLWRNDDRTLLTAIHMHTPVSPIRLLSDLDLETHHSFTGYHHPSSTVIPRPGNTA